MTTIREQDLVQSVADGLQFISCYHPVDFIRAMGAAYEREQSPAARDAIAQILINSRMAAEGRRPAEHRLVHGHQLRGGRPKASGPAYQSILQFHTCREGWLPSGREAGCRTRPPRSTPRGERRKTYNLRP